MKTYVFALFYVILRDDFFHNQKWEGFQQLSNKTNIITILLENTCSKLDSENTITNVALFVYTISDKRVEKVIPF